MGRVVDEAADKLRAEILTGALAAGSKLPPERALAEDLGVSRLTLRSALSRLETEGLVRPRQGSGSEVLDWRTEAGVEVLPFLLERGDLSLLGPLLQLRRAIAVEAVAVACERATDADLDRLDAMAAELAAEPDLLVLAEGNLAFGRAVLQLSGNVAAELLFNTVARAYRARPELMTAMLADSPGIRASFGAVVALLRSRNPEAARMAVRAALEAIDAATLQKVLED